jgi:hypothetical protein
MEAARWAGLSPEEREKLREDIRKKFGEKPSTWELEPGTRTSANYPAAGVTVYDLAPVEPGIDAASI